MYLKRVKEIIEIIQETINNKSWSIFMFHGTGIRKSGSYTLGGYAKYLTKKIQSSPQELIGIVLNKAQSDLKHTLSSRKVAMCRGKIKLEYFRWLCYYLSNIKQIEIFLIKDVIEKEKL
jgi:hypothetical protein